MSKCCGQEHYSIRRSQRGRLYPKCSSCAKHSATGSPPKMIITHTTADGKSARGRQSSSCTEGMKNRQSVPIHMEGQDTEGSPPEGEYITLKEAVEDDISLSSNDGCCRPYYLRKTTKYVLFALVVFFGQIAISVSLKRYGYIEKDFNEIVAERVLPHLQSQLEQTGAWMPQFNNSLYWLRNMNQSLPSMPSRTQPRLRVGFKLAEKGAKAKYPIVMVPGFVTSGLEVWQGKECAKQLFRQKMWGGVGMVQHWLMERHCVMEHMALDPVTGKDPKGIRIRAAQGFEAADYFAGNYWVWSKLLENLADIGYDGSMMSMETYDWRLAFPKLEERDGYLTKLKFRIEAFHKASSVKVVLTSHSLGGILVHYFFAWVTTSERDGGGGGGKDWVDKHIHTYINIAGAQLGVPKAASALLSGEMSDTVVLGAAGSLIEQFLGRKVRKELWTTWGSLWSMLPKGGDSLWNVGADVMTRENDDVTATQFEQGFEDLLTMIDSVGEDSEEQDMEDLVCANEELVDVETEILVNTALQDFSSRKSHTVDEAINFLTTWGGGAGPGISAAQLHSFDPKEKASKRTWHDISRTPLPPAPNMKIYCLYGVGLDTERAYYYKRNKGEGQTGTENNGRVDPPFILDTSVEDSDNKIVHGVKYGDGDGSVPLLSLGYMCADGWRRKETGLNPRNTKIVTREYKHRQEVLFDDPMRGGPYSADHVDILGNLDMMEDFLKIVSDFEGPALEDHIVSEIHEIGERIHKHPKGGLKKKRRWGW